LTLIRGDNHGALYLRVRVDSEYADTSVYHRNQCTKHEIFVAYVSPKSVPRFFKKKFTWRFLVRYYDTNLNTRHGCDCVWCHTRQEAKLWKAIRTCRTSTGTVTSATSTLTMSPTTGMSIIALFSSAIPFLSSDSM
jgi:hypothetical protein